MTEIYRHLSANGSLLYMGEARHCGECEVITIDDIATAYTAGLVAARNIVIANSTWPWPYVRRIVDRIDLQIRSGQAYGIRSARKAKEAK